MTRGKIIVFHKDGIISSTEFNGDMYYECHGREVFENLQKISTIEEYEQFIEDFNTQNFGYSTEEYGLTYNPLDYYTEEDLLDMRTGYFDKWFSDYLYFKNLRDENVVITDDNSIKVIVAPNGIVSLNFGKFNENCVEYLITIDEQSKLEQIRDVCKKCGWAFTEQNNEVYLSKFSPAGEDFGFYVYHLVPEVFIKEVRSYADNFDIDEHAAMWIESRGRNGIPSSIRTLIDDADNIKTMLDELADELDKLIK